jgi:hypothetical protein
MLLLIFFPLPYRTFILTVDRTGLDIGGSPEKRMAKPN